MERERSFGTFTDKEGNEFEIYEVLGAGMRGTAGWIGVGGNYGQPEVPAILAIDLTDVLFPDDVPTYAAMPYADRIAAIEQWCRENNGTYYARGRESLDLSEAYEQAIDEGAEVVVLEDLS